MSLIYRQNRLGRLFLIGAVFGEYLNCFNLFVNTIT